MRAASTWVLAALVLAALFWGNCFSCPQVLLSAKSDTNCCPHSQHQPVKKQCQTQGLQNYVKVNLDLLALAPLAALATAHERWVPSLHRADFVSAKPAEHSPPDLLSLHSTFRI
jgi:hypothetical protein